MNIFELFGTIAINNENANKALSATGSKANSLASTMEKAFSRIGRAAVAIGKTAAVGLAAGAAGVAALATASVKSYAEYEQLKGGIETLFGDSASIVMDYANNAYKTAGLSANEYMSTVTSFTSSLLQSLGGDTEAAAKVADMALTDMADNANKMGTSMELIQNAYQGFAKQNYTMLDNLKLGYGGTQEEMKRLLKDAEKIQKQNGKKVKYDINNLNDIYEAIHVVQEEMGIAGATAAEASETISGSLGSAKAAWDNLVTGMADGNQNIDLLLDNFVQSAKVALDNIKKLLPTLVSSVTKLVSGLIPEIPPILQSLLPSLIDGAVSLISGLVAIMPGALQVLVDTITGFLSKIDFNVIGEAIGNSFVSLVNRIPQLLASVGEAISYGWNTIVWPTVQGLFKAVFNVDLPDWGSILNSITEGWNGTVWPNIQNFFSAVFGIDLPDWASLLTSISEGWNVTILPGIQGFFEAAFNLTLPDWGEILNSISEGWTGTIWPGIQSFFSVAFGLTLPDWGEITTSISDGWNNTILPGISEFFRVLLNISPPDWEEFTAGLQEKWNTLVQPVIDGIVSVFNNDLSSAVNSISTVIDTIVTGFTSFSDWCSEHQETIQNVAIVIASLGSAFGIVNGALAIINAVDTGVSAFGTALTALTSPVGIAVLAIGAIIAIIILCIKYWDDIKAKVTEVAQAIATKWTELKNSLSTVMTSVLIKAVTIWNSIKTKAVELIGGIVTAAQEKFQSIKDTIDEKITAAKDAVSTAIEAIKGFFDFEWELPSIKLPHFSITGSFSLNPPSIPTFSVEWYKKGGILTDPTAFGMNGSKLMVGGEAGPEAVAPIDVLQGYVAEAVASQNAALVSILEAILEALLDMDANMGGHMRDALSGTSFEVNKREFARLVRAVD